MMLICMQTISYPTPPRYQPPIYCVLHIMPVQETDENYNEGELNFVDLNSGDTNRETLEEAANVH